VSRTSAWPSAGRHIPGAPLADQAERRGRERDRQRQRLRDPTCRLKRCARAIATDERHRVAEQREPDQPLVNEFGFKTATLDNIWCFQLCGGGVPDCFDLFGFGVSWGTAGNAGGDHGAAELGEQVREGGLALGGVPGFGGAAVGDADRS
jgi:hypothetical protein